LLKRFEIKGIELAEVTLHTGLGTFRTIDVEDLSKHKTDAEFIEILEKQAKKVNEAKKITKKYVLLVLR
jgi:S-adenosylmethionine:tRNA ribosyltransferase-isomerase